MSVINYTVSKTVFAPLSLKEVSESLITWRKEAHLRKKILNAQGEDEAFCRMDDLYDVADMAAGFVQNLLFSLTEAQEPEDCGVITARNSEGEIRAVAVWGELTKTKGGVSEGIEIYALASHPDNIACSLAKRVAGAASAVMPLLKEIAGERPIVVDTMPLALPFYERHGFALPSPKKNILIYSPRAT